MDTYEQDILDTSHGNIDEAGIASDGNISDEAVATADAVDNGASASAVPSASIDED